MVRLTDRLDMPIVVDWDVKQQNKTNSFGCFFFFFYSFFFCNGYFHDHVACG